MARQFMKVLNRAVGGPDSRGKKKRLAEELGCYPRTLERWLNGRDKPHRHMQLRIMRALESGEINPCPDTALVP